MAISSAAAHARGCSSGGMLSTSLLGRPTLVEFLQQLDPHVPSDTRLYLVGECSLVLEGWRDWTDQIIYSWDGDHSPIERLRAELEIPLLHEPPGEIVPLPAGWEGRA